MFAIIRFYSCSNLMNPIKKYVISIDRGPAVLKLWVDGYESLSFELRGQEMLLPFALSVLLPKSTRLITAKLQRKELEGVRLETEATP